MKLTRLVGALTDVLAQDLADPHKQKLWVRLREVARWKNPTALEVVSALLGVDG